MVRDKNKQRERYIQRGRAQVKKRDREKKNIEI